jgi:hypothetical protein
MPAEKAMPATLCLGLIVGGRVGEVNSTANVKVMAESQETKRVRWLEKRAELSISVLNYSRERLEECLARTPPNQI